MHSQHRPEGEILVSNVKLATRVDDDPRVVEEQARDEYSRHVVPPTARVPRWKMAGTWWLNASAIVFIYYGALSADIAGTKQALVGLALATVTMAVLTPHFVRVSAESGLGSSLISRQIFGRRGANLTVTLIAIGALFYTVVEGSILAHAFALWFDSIELEVWYAVVIIAVVPLALGGVQSWLSKVSSVLLPIYIVGLIAAVVIAAINSSGSMEWLAYSGTPDATSLPGWLKVYIMYMAIWLLLVDQIDFARFGKVSDVRFNSHISFGWVFYLVTYAVNATIGMFLSRVVAPDVPPSEVGVVNALIETLGVFGLVAIIVSQLRINVVNMYIASLNSSRVWGALFRSRLPRFAAVFGIGLLAFLLMLTDVFSYISVALDWLAIIFVAWVGIYFTHYLVAKYKFNDTRIRFRNSETATLDRGVISWFIATIVGGLLIEVPGVPRTLAELAPLVTLVLAVGGQLILMLTKRDDQPVSAAAQSLEQSIGDTWQTRVQCTSCELYYVAVELDARPNEPDGYHCLACERAEATQ
jgi:purine-cytosine permease-like protein